MNAERLATIDRCRAARPAARRRWARVAAGALSLVLPLALSACLAGPPPATAGAAAIADSQPLAGTGAVAFHPQRALLAWADGNRWHTLDLDSGRRSDHLADAAVADLGFAADGDLWLIADRAERWREGRRVCRSEAGDLSRWFGADADGAAVARYQHSDGVGPLRQQLWLGPDCRTVREDTRPLPARIREVGDDPGEPLRAGAAPAAAGLAERLPAIGADGATARRTLALSHDGRWRVVDENGQRILRRTGAP